MCSLKNKMAVLLALVCSIFVGCVCASMSNQKSNSKVVEPKAGISFLELYFDETMVSTLTDIKKVESYLLNPGLKDTSALSFHRYSVINTPVKLSENQIYLLQDILSNKDNYQQDSIVKSCTFLPDVAFRCYVNDSIFTDILVAYYCDDWLFISEKKQYYKDCSKARKALVYLAKDIYKEDNYIQKLSDNN